MKILVTGAWHHTENQIDQIKCLGCEVVFMKNENEVIPCDYESIDGVICNGLFLHHHIEKFVNLKYIQLTSAGLDRVPLGYVKSHDIVLKNAAGVYSIPMAEFALSSVLSLYKQSDHFRRARETHVWNKHRGLREIYGKRVCIVGCGNVGSECAIRFKAMGCDVVGIDEFSGHKNGYREVFPTSKLKDIAAESDIIILALPLTNETMGLIDYSILNSLPQDAIIVNIARGAIIDTEALIDVISVRSDITAVLDVFDVEPLPVENELWNMSNVVITPHNSFVGEGNCERLWSVIYNNLREFCLN